MQTDSSWHGTSSLPLAEVPDKKQKEHKKTNHKETKQSRPNNTRQGYTLSTRLHAAYRSIK